MRADGQSSVKFQNQSVHLKFSCHYFLCSVASSLRTPVHTAVAITAFVRHHIQLSPEQPHTSSYAPAAMSASQAWNVSIQQALQNPLTTFSQLVPSRARYRSMASDGKGSPWSFDVSSFMILLGEAEEVNFRHMRRSIIECICAAPVAGLQSYLKSPESIFDVTGMAYFSPYGCKSAPLRDMQLNHCLQLQRLLRDGQYSVYTIQTSTPKWYSHRNMDIPSICLATCSWIIFSAIIVFLHLVDSGSWIGLASCIFFSGYSMFLKLAEKFYAEPARIFPANPDAPDAIYILGRRNSAFVLLGSRADIARMTGQGLQLRDGAFPRYLAHFSRVGAIALLVFVFAVVPNCTTWDQVGFIALNILGQANVLIGQRLNAKRFLRKLQLEQKEKVETRTHVYGNLLRRFGNGDWVEKADLLPQTDVWAQWRQRVIN